MTIEHNNPGEESSMLSMHSGICDDSNVRFLEINAHRLAFPDHCHTREHVSAKREEKKSHLPFCPETECVHNNLSRDKDSSEFSAINERPFFVNSSVKAKDDGATWSGDDPLPLRRRPEAVSDEPTCDNLPLYDATGSCSRAGSSEPICRICQEGDQKYQLDSPCSCSSTIGLMHAPCLEHWLTECNDNFCEVCGDRFQMVSQPFTALRFCWVSQNKGQLLRELLCDLLGILAVEILIFVCVFYVLVRMVLTSDDVAWCIVFLYVIKIA